MILIQSNIKQGIRITRNSGQSETSRGIQLTGAFSGLMDSDKGYDGTKRQGTHIHALADTILSPSETKRTQQ